MPNNYILLDRIELNNTAASITFDNIPQTGYTDLKIVMSANCTGSGSSADDIRIRFNGNTSATYSMRSINGSGSGVSSASETGQTSSWCGNIGGTGSIFNNAEIYIPNYLSTSNAKSTSVDNVVEANATAAPMQLIAQLWNPSTQAAISSVTLFPSTYSWTQYSTFSLYGIAAVGTTPAVAPKADGGNVIATDGTYWYHAFLSNGTFTPQVGLNADVLAVAGGGGASGGAGGAGGVIYFASQSLTATGYNCLIGSGGSGAAVSSSDGIDGGNSQFGLLTVALGGGGGGYNVTARNGHDGGSGGGGSSSDAARTYGGSSTQTGTGATAYYGNAGGGNATNYTVPPYANGGGGGAGAAGTSAPSQFTGGNGGDGTTVFSTWGLATNTGQNSSGTVYYAGGGAGGTYSSGGASGTAGKGGGGTGGVSAVGSNGTANTGGGAGGGNAYPAAAGGSGIIIIRYLVA